ncbi:MAG TPA: DUF1569 domain-containing protein [Lacibacter sp.]|nr:DUF1569 domain-containing protein [Lacibacter sp.]HMO88595.1 DUF1569 domain-containing protein [Lacibacter sp.]HMP87567.1 DUF1569 domain-containing protein [Lacibacter sp.]
MQTIHELKSRQQLAERLGLLTPATPRLWGTMQPAEMLWHLRSQLELALGLQPLKTDVKSMLRLPPLRWLAIRVMPWPKGSPTAPEMHVRKANPIVQEFGVERELLLRRLEEVAEAKSLGPHPLFGPLSTRLWGFLVWKHFDHHLRQFTV